MGDSDSFALFIHHGGYIGEFDGVDCYMKGYSIGIFGLKRSSFNFIRLNQLVKALGYASWTKIWYKLPRTNLFRWIKGDEEVKQMMSILGANIAVLSVYVEGGVDDNSGRLQKHNNLDEVEGRHLLLTEVGESESVVDLGGIDRVDVDGVVTQLEVSEMGDDYADDELDKIMDEAFDEYEGDQNEADETEHERGESDDDDDGLDDDDLADGDMEYIEARKNMKETEDEELSRLLQEFVSPDNIEDEEPVSEYEPSDCDINSDETDEDEDFVFFSKRRVVYDPKCDHKNLQLLVGMKFQDGWECRRALTTHSIETGKFIQFRRVSKKQCEARCFKPCKWKVYASVVSKDQSFCIKSYGGDHDCPRHMSNKLLSSKWIAMRYLNVFRVRPHFSIADLKQDIMDRFEYEIPKDRLYKARTLARDMVRGTVDHHYGLIRRYVAELRRVDREGRYELLLDDDHVFKGLYLGFSSLIKGFKASCRPIIGLDGCHLKTYLGGILLCAIAKDGNDQMFPIVWAVVGVENEECWSWFLKCLIEDIGIGDGNGYTFVSDQQKGLENAVAQLVPYAEHRNCMRHIYMNWKKEHKGSTLKKLFLNAARSTYIEKFKEYLLEMQKESMAAYHDFMSRDTHKFCKAFISTSCCSDMVDNNISETFNGYILNARGKHIIHMCEEIRSNLMVRQVNKRDEMRKVTDRICPMIRKKLEQKRHASRHCIPKPNLFNKFEVSYFADKFVVDVVHRTCSCREWDICGIPCVHAVAAIHYMGKDPSDYVHEYYTVEKYLKGYEYGLEPLRGEMMWPEVDGFKVKPPAVRRMPGRPKKKRIRSAAEKEQGNPNKLPRTGLVMTCKKCGMQGHNRKKCQNVTLQILPKPKGKRGRPAKQQTPAESQTTTTSNDDGGARGGGRGGTRGHARGGARFQAPRGASGRAADLARERNFARRGAGVFIGQGTGNIYYSAPGSNVVNHVNRRANDVASSSRVNESGASAGTSTQGSRNASQNATSI